MSGFRDILSENIIPRQKMINTIRGVYESYGYVPLDTLAIERYETLTGKYGPEGEKLMYKFTDHGGRLVALRYDLTVPLARVVAQHKDEIPLPYKRYQIGNVWRGESPQAGRYREFMQFDADTVGTGSSLADAEVIMMMCDTMKALGVNAVVRVNNRKILDGLAQKVGLSQPDDAKLLISTIDKTEKLGHQRIIEEIASLFGEETSKVVFEFLTISGDTLERLREIRRILSTGSAAEEGTSNLHDVFTMLNAAGYDESVVMFDQTIARGLDYYTGIIYETTLTDLPKIGSVCSGGRFDKLIAALSDGKVDLPAVGTSVGVDRLFTALQQLGKIETARTKSQVLIVNFADNLAPEYVRLATTLRLSGIPTEVYYDPIKLDRQLKYADRVGIPWVVLLGSDELERGVIKVKNLRTGEQRLMKLEDFISSFT